MNILKGSAGYVTGEHIKKSGFSVFEVIKGNDMGQMSYEIPQYTDGKVKITGGYWNWVVSDMDGNQLFSGWWNSNEEFDETIEISVTIYHLGQTPKRGGYNE